MATLNQLTKYSTALEKRILRGDRLIDILIENMDQIILDGMMQTIQKSAGKEIGVKLADQLYKAMDWSEIKRDMLDMASGELEKFLSMYQTEINQLSELYPEASYKRVSGYNQWEKFERSIRRSIDPETLMAGSKLKVQAYFDTIQAGLVTDNISALKTILSRYTCK